MNGGLLSGLADRSEDRGTSRLIFFDHTRFVTYIGKHAGQAGPFVNTVDGTTP